MTLVLNSKRLDLLTLLVDLQLKITELSRKLYSVILESARGANKIFHDLRVEIVFDLLISELLSLIILDLSLLNNGVFIELDFIIS